MYDFKQGDKVVCVEDGDFHGVKTPTGLVKGEIYTVVSVKPFLRDIHVNLSELFEPTGWGYRHQRFRPVAKRSDTLSIESFLTIKPGQFEEPKRVVEPVRPKKEKA